MVVINLSLINFDSFRLIRIISVCHNNNLAAICVVCIDRHCRNALMIFHGDLKSSMLSYDLAVGFSLYISINTYITIEVCDRRLSCWLSLLITLLYQHYCQLWLYFLQQ